MKNEAIKQGVLAVVGIIARATSASYKTAFFVKGYGRDVAAPYLQTGFLHTHFTGRLQERVQRAAGVTLASFARSRGEIDDFYFVVNAIKGNVGEQTGAAPRAKGREMFLPKSAATKIFRPGARETGALEVAHGFGVGGG